MNRIIAVCDDEPMEIENTVREIRKVEAEMKDQYQIFTYSDGESLLSDIEEKGQIVDTVFLDIEMSGMNGVEVAERLNQTLPNCNVIYLTNYLQYATEVYNTEHYFFILKKELSKRLYQVREKTLRLADEEKDFILIPLSGNEMATLKKEEIRYVERSGRVTRIFTTTNLYMTKLKMNEMEWLLGETQFARCHNSFIAGLRYIVSYKREALVIEGDVNIPISRRYQPVVREKFMKWSREHLF